MSSKKIKLIKTSLGWCVVCTALVGVYSMQEQQASSSGAPTFDVYLMCGSFVLLACLAVHLMLVAFLADSHPRLKVYVPGCLAAAVLALAVRASWLILRIDVQDLAIAWEVFLLMVSIQAGILLELATGFLRRARVPPQTRA